MTEQARYRRAYIALFVGSFITFSHVYMCQPLLPLLAREFSLTSAQASLAMSMVLFPVGLSFLFYAPLARVTGKKKLMVTVLVLSSFPVLGAALTGSFSAILVSRLVDGLLLAGFPAIAMAYVGQEFPRDKLATAMGLYISGTSLGGMGGRLISGFAAASHSWQAAFVLLGLIHLVGALAFARLLPPSREFKPEPYRPFSAFGESLNHLKNPRLRGAYITACLIMFNFVGIYNALTFRLAAPPYNFAPDLLGLLFLTYVSGTVSSAVIGRLSRRRGVLFSAKSGLLLAVAGLLLTTANSILLILAGLLVMAFGFFAAHSSASAWVSSTAAANKSAAAGVYVLFYYLGAGIAGLLLIPVWDALGWWEIGRAHV